MEFLIVSFPWVYACCCPSLMWLVYTFGSLRTTGKNLPIPIFVTRGTLFINLTITQQAATCAPDVALPSVTLTPVSYPTNPTV
jgi:hypothetical protein